jgi:murein DD-endopeptidase MepM/ murein hydrolase activator NlpD
LTIKGNLLNSPRRSISEQQIDSALVDVEKRRILTQLLKPRDARLGPIGAVVAISCLSLFSIVTAFGTAPGTLEIAGISQPIVQQLAPPPISVIDVTGDIFVREDRIQRGDTVDSLLGRLGVDNKGLAFLRGDARTAVIFRQMSPGKSVTARVGGDGSLHSLVFPLNGGNDLALVVEHDRTKGFRVSEQGLALDTHVLMKSAEIKHSLFAATDAVGIPDGAATQLADIFGGDIDFHRDLRKGDRFSVVYESINHLGKFVRTGRILAAEFINDGKTYRAVWFDTGDGKGGYYTADGRNIRKAFLRSPLEFSRITSGFSNARFHPVLKELRAHRGIDYGAPVGTRVRATGDGVVEFIGTQGGYGKLLVLRHQNQYITVYGHLSGFAPGLHKGSRVAQGNLIGYVGATGLATGPHLHYEFRVNGVHRNPLTIALPTATPLAPQQLERFRADTLGALTSLDLLGGGNIALLD